MSDNCYSFFQQESPDGVDYLFSTKYSRIYTVSFDMSIYASYVENFPTLLKYGYGILFGYERTIPRQLKTAYQDDNVGITIVEIIADFLNSDHDIFAIMQCESHKQNKIFQCWLDKYKNKENYFYNGLEIVIKETDKTEYFGFICSKENKLIKEAVNELDLFSMSLSRENK